MATAPPPPPTETAPLPTAQQQQTQSQPPLQSPEPNTPAAASGAVKIDTPAAVSAATASDASPAPPVSYTITIPGCSAWFSWDKIHETERRLLPEFFTGNLNSRNPNSYKYYRDSIISQFRTRPTRKLTFTEARRGLVGDVGSIRKVFDFLEEWGLINYVPLAKKSKEKREEGVKEEESIHHNNNNRRICSGCRSVCTLVCFTTDKADITLCPKCFVRNNYRPGLSSTDFKRVDITEESRADWTDKETLHLLEAVLQYGEDWKKVAEYVASRSEKDCVARFVKLPFGEQFLSNAEKETIESMGGYNGNYEQDEGPVDGGGESLKRRRLSPLADTSNPIMAQVALLSAIAGPHAAESVAQAAVAALSEFDANEITIDPSIDDLKEEDVSTVNGESSSDLLKEIVAKAQLELEKENEDIEKSLSDIVQVQMKEIQDKLIRFEKLELLMEREWAQLRHMKDSLFADQLAIAQNQQKKSVISTEIKPWERFGPLMPGNIIGSSLLL